MLAGKLDGLPSLTIVGSAAFTRAENGFQLAAEPRGDVSLT